MRLHSPVFHSSNWYIFMIAAVHEVAKSAADLEGLSNRTQSGVGDIHWQNVCSIVHASLITDSV